MKTLFLRYLPLCIAVVIGVAGVIVGPTAQAVALETVRQITPENARHQLESWLSFLTWAVPSVGVVCSVVIAQILKLKEQVRAQGEQVRVQGARHDAALATVNAALSAPVASLLPAVVVPVAAAVQTPAPPPAPPAATGV